MIDGPPGEIAERLVDDGPGALLLAFDPPEMHGESHIEDPGRGARR